MRVIELFAGAGGLGIGVSRAGFAPSMIVERDRWCCDTLRENRHVPLGGSEAWPLPLQGDIRFVDFRREEGKVALVTGGPPCQPFSLGGKHRAHADHRDMWSEAVRVVREVRPKAFIFENVRGLARQAFATYLSYIELQLQYPSVFRLADEAWEGHLKRLQQHHSAGGRVEYRVLYELLDAADYGVPQRRHRVVFVGFREGVKAGWSFPCPTHSLDALLRSQAIEGEYWERHRIPNPARVSPFKPRRSGDLLDVSRKPWLTVRDAIDGLPDANSPEAALWNNHRQQPGARSYPGHTGSSLDAPAKALKAGVHGVPGGENTLRMHDGTVRYFTVREAARLQAFPDEWRFHGSWSESMRQLGNAVPTTLGEVVAKSVKTHLERSG